MFCLEGLALTLMTALEFFPFSMMGVAKRATYLVSPTVKAYIQKIEISFVKSLVFGN